MPERGVRDNLIYSTDAPRIQIQVADTFRYVGNLNFILKGVAWVDIYYFAEADAAVENAAGAHLRRTFHVQFEGYLPDNTHSYRYSSTELVRLGDHDYQFDAAFWSPTVHVPANPNSDFAAGHRLLQAQGYDADGMRDTMRERYVRVLDDACRNEILLIYNENLAPYGVTADDLEGEAADQWERLRAEMHKRARSAFRVTEG
ncbi:MAG: hypothetical protein ABI835_19970 [Chloroflexota bacterium]